MGPKSAHSSRTSLVSIDPAVASHITSPKPSATSQHTRAGSSPVTKISGSTATGHTKGHGRNNSAPSKNQAKRSTSLKRAKNSTEVLRQRSTKKEGDFKDHTSDTKRGRNFTVTNVGTGGMLYLRPSTKQGTMSPTMSPPAPASLPAPASTLTLPQQDDTYLLLTEHNPYGRTLGTRTRSVSPKRLLQRVNKAKEQNPIRPSHVRSQSFSTIDESRKSITSSWPKTLKIVINRLDPGEPEPVEKDDKPSLEIPIPHYRLGVPRFSVHGTPILRNSVHSRTSSSPSIRRVSTGKPDSSTAPPPASMKAFAKLQNIDPSVDITPGQHNQQTLRYDTYAGQTSYSIGRPLTPSIYDELSDHYNDPSVVRFAHDDKDVTAATPARIVAQISSESFMDYELVSDFFLTFRSYMSTYEVLDLLLARLAWAIGRMSDDGRIIRIRTFAALRHWILNYFMDDFVTDRRIRVRFCDEVNDLYYDVRNKHIGGPSDLKILQDLKRCWNGRCSLYWDGEEFDMDGNQDAELHPGGVVGSRHPAYTNVAELPPPLPALVPMPQGAPTTSARVVSPTAPRQTQHNRQQASFASSGVAESLESEQSIQVHSCSVLLKPIRVVAEATAHQKRPHPVTVLERRQKAPSALQVQVARPTSQRQQHRRGGNSFDSTRERTPSLNSAIAAPWLENYSGSVVRGFAYAPVEPFVRVPSNMPLSPSGPLNYPTASNSVGTDHSSYLVSGSPAMKNIFGSIRRALSGRQGPNDMALITISAPQNTQTAPGKKSPMPLKMSKSHDELRRKATTIPPRSPIRIDLLCAAAIESYQSRVPGISNTIVQEPLLDMPAAHSRGSPPPIPTELAMNSAGVERVASHGTAQSGSILIVDGTGFGAPTMSGAIQYPQGHDSDSFHTTHSDSAGNEIERSVSFETQIAFEDDAQRHQEATTHPQSQDVMINSAEDTPKGMPTNMYPSAASSTIAGNRQSLTSTNTQLRTQTSIEETGSAITSPQDYQEGSIGDGSKTHGQILRRRPGGDLRNVQSVHDLESPVPHHESLDSIMDTASSPAQSLVVMTNAPQIPPTHPSKATLQKVSMIHTHSSQHLRPSFEAAVAGFSAIPDDNDGGLEATLLKLEGRYESPDLKQLSPSLAPSDPFSGSTIPTERHSVEERDINLAQRTHPQGHYQTQHQAVTVGHNSGQRLDANSQHLLHRGNLEPSKQIVPGSEGSETSLPLLRRESSGVAKLGGLHSQMSEPMTGGQIGLGLSHNVDRQELPAENMNDRGLDRPETAETVNSYLFDQDDNLSDLSSDISVDIINYSEALGKATSPLLVAPGTAVSGLEIPSHPLAHSSFVNLSMHPSLALDGGRGSSDLPVTPELSPIRKRHDSDKAKTVSKQKVRRTQIPVGPAHVPFVLACDSQVLAQQLTIIEQSALTEIEWSDLVEMRWSSKPAKILDWAEYVTKQDVRGVDLVVTRFNLMVKWTVSEIVLTQNIEERVRVITKFIHVAAHARRLHNYATMLQLTIALTSTDCSRLVKTWQLVSSPDKSLLRNMEILIQPIRNFHDLRLEMESADLTDGCIPFIGQGHQPLINFERFRTSAIIVKGLLRLIDASSKYNFEPVHGIVERCLWIASLEDERIRSLSRTLETLQDTA